jgi:hypothetical protein
MIEHPQPISGIVQTGWVRNFNMGTPATGQINDGCNSVNNYSLSRQISVVGQQANALELLRGYKSG